MPGRKPGLLDVSPTLFSFNGSDCCVRHTISLSNVIQCSVFRSYREGLGFCQFSDSIGRSNRSVSPTFSIHVGHIVCRASQEKMIYPDTSRNVAMVTNVNPGWDDSVVKRPRHSVSSNGFVADSEVSVPMSIAGSSPKPASRVLDHKSPKPIFDRTLTTKPVPTGFGATNLLGIDRCKGVAALRADFSMLLLSHGDLLDRCGQDWRMGSIPILNPILSGRVI